MDDDDLIILAAASTPPIAIPYLLRRLDVQSKNGSTVLSYYSIPLVCGLKQ
jgi:hypothetical protein